MSSDSLRTICMNQFVQTYYVKLLHQTDAHESFYIHGVCIYIYIYTHPEYIYINKYIYIYIY